MTPVVPFLRRAIARAAQLVWPAVVGRAGAAVVGALAAGLFAFFNPVLTARPLQPDAWASRIWFTDRRSEAVEGDPQRPRLHLATPSPDGWCWI